MRIHGNSMSINAANLYAAAQEERAATAQRAASVRKKLIKSASEIDGAASPEETLMISQWVNSQQQQAQNKEQYSDSVSGQYVPRGTY
jgi:hypothetical protein